MSLISELFRGRSSQPVVNNNPNVTQANPNPQDKVQQQNPAADPTKPGNIPPSGTSNPTNPNEPISPLDNYSKLWDSPTTPDGKPKVDPLTQPLVTTDPQKLAEAARKMDFTSGVDPALIAKALGGDATALRDLINASTQNAFIASATLGNSVVEGATRTNNSRLDQTLEEKFKEFMVRQQKSENPILQHKAVSPILDLAKRQLTQQFPDLTAGEIQARAEAYVSDFASAFNTRETEETKRKAGPVNDAQDFSSWAG